LLSAVASKAKLFSNEEKKKKKKKKIKTVREDI